VFVCLSDSRAGAVELLDDFVAQVQLGNAHLLELGVRQRALQGVEQLGRRLDAGCSALLLEFCYDYPLAPMSLLDF
jgi:hypothetical protein